MMSSELPPMVGQYTGHVIQTETLHSHWWDFYSPCYLELYRPDTLKTQAEDSSIIP